MNLKPELTREEHGELPEALQQAYRADGDGYTLDLAPHSDSPAEKLKAVRRAEQIGDVLHQQVIAAAVEEAGLTEDHVTAIMERSRVLVGPDGAVDVRLYLDDDRTIEAPSTKTGVFYKTLDEHLDELRTEIAEQTAREEKPKVNADDIVFDRTINGTRVTRYADGRIRIAGMSAEEFSRLPAAEQLRLGRAVNPPKKPAQAPRTWPGIVTPSERRPA